jgi:L-lactate dehydrogenase complex protein LldE
MNDSSTCCGFGGTFAVKFEPISIAMGEQKSRNAADTGAEYIISTDMSCLMHLDGYMRNQQMNLQVLHLADVLASGWE